VWGDGGSRGGMAMPSDRAGAAVNGLFRSAIETGLALRLVLISRFANRGGATIIARLYRSRSESGPYDFSRRGGGLMITERVERNEPLHLPSQHRIKIYGEGEWLDQKHGVRSCRRWRKLIWRSTPIQTRLPAVELTPGRCRR